MDKYIRLKIGAAIALTLGIIILIVLLVQDIRIPFTFSMSKAEMNELLLRNDIIEISDMYNSGKLKEDDLNTIQTFVESQLEDNYLHFTEGKVTQTDFADFTKNAALINPIEEKALNLRKKSEEIEDFHNVYKEALKLSDEEDFLGAIDLKETIPKDIFSLFETSEGPLFNIESKLLPKYVTEARNKISAGEYEEALNIGTKLEKYFPDNPDVKNIIFSSNNIVPFDGIVQHIFFHPLIAYPERAFNGGPSSAGQDAYMTTVHEFKETLRQLYENNYVLIDAKAMFDAPLDEKGAVVSLAKKPVMIPEGKKPVIISIDDINYYDYMKTDGQVFKLVLDDKGEVATYSKDMSGEDVISKDNEVVPILDEFTKQYPDFSINGAKGMLCLTSYNGILGYKTGPENDPQYAEGNKEVMPIVNKLKETGWYFATHGDGHRHSSEISDALFIKDTDDWLASTRHLIGYTPLYVYPYGEEVPVGSAKMKYAQAKGFAMFCSVGSPMFQEYGGDYLRQSRRNVDGLAMKDSRLYDLFDVKKLVDPVRPWYNEYIENVWPK